MKFIKQTREFREWRESLGTALIAEKVRARLTRFESGNPGNVKPVGDGVFEMRIDYGPGFRMYYTRVETVTYFMLWGGDKGIQQGDIERAHALAAVIRGK